MDEAPGPADDIGAVRIIVRTNGFVVGIRGNEGSLRRNEGSPWGNDVHTAADIVGARPGDDSVERSADGVRRRSSESDVG